MLGDFAVDNNVVKIDSLFSLVDGISELYVQKQILDAFHAVYVTNQNQATYFQEACVHSIRDKTPLTYRITNLNTMQHFQYPVFID